MRLDGKRTLVTGGAGGIGSAIARRMVTAGAIITIADINADRAIATARNLGTGHFSTTVDVSSLASVTSMVSEAERLMGGIDVLVHTAGVAMLRDVLEVDPADWKRVIDINLMGTYYCDLMVAKSIIARRGSGSLINIGSAAATRPSRGASAYGAAKAGVVNLTKSLAIDLAKHNIRVNTISPGPVDTNMAATEHSSAVRENFVKLIPMGRYARPEELGSAAVFLASDESSYVDGVEILVDGAYVGAGNLY
jgi:NAD(P)-dependent dehydrogenase (short-subunit alcohol dehydrogenase family)